MLVARMEGEIVGRASAFLAAWSTFSLPGIPVCPGAHMNVTGTLFEEKIGRRAWIRAARGCRDVFEMVKRAANESEMTRKGVGGEGKGSVNKNSMQLKIAWSSVVKEEALFRWR